MKLVVNGADVEVDDRHAKTPLLWVLRDVIGMHGTKFGCGAGFVGITKDQLERSHDLTIARVDNTGGNR